MNSLVLGLAKKDKDNKLSETSEYVVSKEESNESSNTNNYCIYTSSIRKPSLLSLTNDTTDTDGGQLVAVMIKMRRHGKEKLISCGR